MQAGYRRNETWDNQRQVKTKHRQSSYIIAALSSFSFTSTQLQFDLDHFVSSSSDHRLFSLRASSLLPQTFLSLHYLQPSSHLSDCAAMSLAPNPPPRPPPPPPLPGFFVRLGSFVNMFDEDRCSEWFAKLSLSRDYHPEATLSLESFLQAHYPQYEFCNSNNPRLAKIAHKWLTSGAGLHFWRPDCANQATTPEDRIHVWDDDKPELEYGIYQLLLLEAPRMKRFFAVSFTNVSFRGPK